MLMLYTTFKPHRPAAIFYDRSKSYTQVYKKLSIIVIDSQNPNL